MSVLTEQPPPGEAVFDFVEKGTARRKWVTRRKRIAKARALTVSHISPWNILPREVAGTSSPFRGLEKRPSSRENMSQKDWGHPRRRPGQIGCNHFSSQISIVLESVFYLPFANSEGKKLKNTYTHSWLLGTLVQLWVPQRTPPQNIFPIQRHLVIFCSQIVIFESRVLKTVHCLGFWASGLVGLLIPCSL